MKLYIDTTSICLQSYEEDERYLFKSEAENIGLKVESNKLNNLVAFGLEYKLYILLFTLTACGMKLEVH